MKRRIRLEEIADLKAFCQPAGNLRFGLSPLGLLYRREYVRLTRQFPALHGSTCDLLILQSFAHIFLDADADELAQAMIEGSPELLECTEVRLSTYVFPLVRIAIDAAQSGKGADGG